MTVLYGIRNCDTVKKARRWLDARKIDYRFHDFRADGLTEAQVRIWLADLGSDRLINKRSTSWKNLGAHQQAALNAQSAVQLILDNPTLIKRPLVETGKRRLVGFDTDTYSDLFE
ncbi:MAG: ArsC family reductase [Cellvibrionaceae bacterium]